jgi:rRNA maturation protein Nop10
MALRRICTIAGRSYTLTGHCPKCNDPMWTTVDPPAQEAGCTTVQCLNHGERMTAPDPPRATPDATGDPTTPSSHNDEDSWMHPE